MTIKGTTTKHTLDKLRGEGWTAATVEVYNSMTGRRKDMFGFADIVALRPGHPILAIQTTTKSNVSAHIHKITHDCADAAQLWLQAGGQIEVWGWAIGTGGRRKWTADVRKILFEHIAHPEEIRRQKRDLGLRSGLARALAKDGD